MICTVCHGPVYLDDEYEEGVVCCPECGIWYDTNHPAVQRDMWLVEHGMPPVFIEEMLYGVIDERDELRRICVERQGDICVVCGHGMYGDSAVHESVIKRSDLPGDDRIFTPVNCVALHHTTGCHENTKQVDEICTEYLISHYGLGVVQEFIMSLEMTELPGRAKGIMNLVSADQMESG